MGLGIWDFGIWDLVWLWLGCGKKVCVALVNATTSVCKLLGPKEDETVQLQLPTGTELGKKLSVWHLQRTLVACKLTWLLNRLQFFFLLFLHECQG